MPEILTESFCERCGTRYTFESAAPRKTRRLGQIKTLSKGMKNWVMSDDTSLDEAMAAARNDDDRELTSHQLDAFHATFNFCMTCRQYTCGNCWNTAEGRCLTCAPHLGHEILPAAFPDAAFEPVRIEAEAWPEVDLSVADAAPGGNGAAAASGNGFHPETADPWASTGATDVDDIPEIDPAARLAFLSGEAPAPVVGPEPSVAAEPAEWRTPEPTEPEPLVADERPTGTPVAAADDVDLDAPFAEGADAGFTAARPAGVDDQAEVAPAVEPLPPTVEGKASAGAARTADLLRRFRPGQNIDAELAAYEASLDAAETPVAPEQPLAPGLIAPEPAREATPAQMSPVAPPDAAPSEPPSIEIAPPVAAAPAPTETQASPTPQAAPVAAEAEAAPLAPELPDAPREDRIQQPTWQIYAPDATPAVGRPLDGDVRAPDPSQPAPPPAAPPQWPARPEIESPAMALLTNRANRTGSEGLWAASAQEVLARPALPTAGAPAGVQPCSNCGLSLSATARFCRRCGSRQG